MEYISCWEANRAKSGFLLADCAQTPLAPGNQTSDLCRTIGCLCKSSLTSSQVIVHATPKNAANIGQNESKTFLGKRFLLGRWLEIIQEQSCRPKNTPASNFKFENVERIHVSSDRRLMQMFVLTSSSDKEKKPSETIQ